MRWTNEEIQYLKNNYGKMKAADLNLPGRSIQAIQTKARQQEY